MTVWTGTGESYAEWWVRSSVDERREFLKKHKVKAHFRPDALAIDPGDLIENIRQQGVSWWGHTRQDFSSARTDHTGVAGRKAVQEAHDAYGFRVGDRQPLGGLRG